MTHWMGLDSGGTEQLWEPDVLIDILRVMKDHEPFSRGQPGSPIFDDLRLLHPDITWGEFRADGSFNPIFRRANPIVKLGLSSPETENATITELGLEVLSGNIDLPDVFAIAASEHTEQDGAKSMSQMCLAGLQLPNHNFSDAEIEFGVSKAFVPDAGQLAEVIRNVRAQNLRVSSTSRKRRIRSFMNALVHSGAFAATQNGWVLRDEEQARKIAQTTAGTTAKVVTEAAKAKGKTKRSTFAKAETENRQRVSFDLSKSGKADPVQTAIALERSSQLHEDIVASLGKELIQLDFDIFEDPDSFDLAIFRECSAIFEVKTVTQKNVVTQIRKAVVQLEEYRWKHLDQFEASPQLFIAISHNPISFLDENYFDFIERDRQMKIIWPEPVFVDRQGTELPELLTPER